jgi:phage terminase Nu1 subunit (DNA packaging protein)
MPGRLVNQSELSEILDVSKPTITLWCRENGMPIAVQGKRGQTNSYDIGACFRWYGQWQVDKVLAVGATVAGKRIDG